jgi:hypothetical protein
MLILLLINRKQIADYSSRINNKLVAKAADLFYKKPPSLVITQNYILKFYYSVLLFKLKYTLKLTIKIY